MTIIHDYRPVEIEWVLNVAKQSECTRRKYGAVIVRYSNNEWLSKGFNQRVGRCCNGICVRDTLNIEHGRNTDAGAEIHAEQAALVDLQHFVESEIYVAGLDKDGKPMNGFDNAPCYSCARMIKYAGIYYVQLPVNGEWERFDIEDIMETWEAKWRDNVTVST